MRKIFVAGIDTNVGKTLVSAILVEALKADYWKPVQTGTIESTDSLAIQHLISNQISKIHKEAYSFKAPLSPHAAAKLEEKEILPGTIQLPQATNATLIIEGAGGLMVPLTENYLLIDLIQKLTAEVVLVIKNYLGSINHSLLSIEALKNRNISLLGVIFNGQSTPASEEVIIKYTGVSCIGRIYEESTISKDTIIKYASNFSLV